jgi:hypothetical protein
MVIGEASLVIPAVYQLEAEFFREPLLFGVHKALSGNSRTKQKKVAKRCSAIKEEAIRLRIAFRFFCVV